MSKRTSVELRPLSRAWFSPRGRSRTSVDDIRPPTSIADLRPLPRLPRTDRLLVRTPAHQRIKLSRGHVEQHFATPGGARQTIRFSVFIHPPRQAGLFGNSTPPEVFPSNSASAMQRRSASVRPARTTRQPGRVRPCRRQQQRSSSWSAREEDRPIRDCASPKL